MTYNAQQFRAEFESAAGKISAQSTKFLTAAYAAWKNGQLTTPELAALLVELLGVANAYGRGLADVIAARGLLLLHGHDVEPAGVGPPGVTPESETNRLRAAISTLLGGLDEADQFRIRLIRLAGSEPIAAMQEQMRASLAGHGVTGYIRGLDTDPCELCVWLNKNDYIYPIDRPMWQHPGCACTPVPAKERTTPA